ncbi:hypothetical protein RB195_013716 [Necator americanus]|uniref:Uncharacterized protein n=1 Tax=Necator americanus TaxID=51031 RepID=A0ABR1DWX1_NECAM
MVLHPGAGGRRSVMSSHQPIQVKSMNRLPWEDDEKEEGREEGDVHIEERSNAPRRNQSSSHDVFYDDQGEMNGTTPHPAIFGTPLASPSDSFTTSDAWYAAFNY